MGPVANAFKHLIVRTTKALWGRVPRLKGDRNRCAQPVIRHDLRSVLPIQTGSSAATSQLILLQEATTRGPKNTDVKPVS